MENRTFSSHEVVKVGARRGVINPEGYTIVPVIYKTVEIIEKFKLVEVSTENDKYGVYNFYGKLIVPTDYIVLECYSGIIVAKKDSFEKDIYDYDGNILVRASAKEEVMVLRGWIAIKHDNWIRFFDWHGKLVADLEGEEGEDWNMVVSISINRFKEQCNVYDCELLKIEVGEFEKLSIQEEFIAAKKNGKWEILFQR